MHAHACVCDCAAMVAYPPISGDNGHIMSHDKPTIHAPLKHVGSMPATHQHAGSQPIIRGGAIIDYVYLG